MMLDNKKSLFPVFALAIFLTGCGASKVRVTADIPRPLINQLPLNTYVLYTDEFANYQYKEKEKGRALSRLTFGPAQQTLFEQIFSELVIVNTSAESANLDLIIEPEILDLQYTSPKETKLNLFEVWLRYRVKITDPQNNVLADWVIKGYGKTPSATFKTNWTAFNAATNVALRDVGAQLSIGFPKQPAIKTLLDQKAIPSQTQKVISPPSAIVDDVDQS